jgi:O-antigen/teichoic acid export membrane protein
MIRSIASQAAGAAFNMLVGFALLMFLGRWLAPEDFARYVSLLSAAVVALIVIAGGNPLWLYRESVTASAVQMRPRVALAVAQALLVCALLAAAAWCLQGTAALFAMLTAGALALADFVSAQLRAQGRFAREAGWQIALRLASAAAIVAAVMWHARDAGSIFLAWLLPTVVLLAVVARFRLAWPRIAGLPAHLALVAPIVLVDGLLALLLRGDVAVLASRFAPRELADYAACTRFTEAAILAFAPISNVLIRYLGLRRGAPREFARTWQQALAMAMALGALAILAAWVAGEAVVRAVFGVQYADAGQLLWWVALALPFLLANGVLALAMLASGRERQLALVLAAGVAAWLAALLFGAPLGLRAVAAGAAMAHAAMTLVLGLMLLQEREA